MYWSRVFFIAWQKSSVIVILYLKAIQDTFILNFIMVYFKYVYLITFSLLRSLTLVK